jgi:hypothetical protein
MATHQRESELFEQRESPPAGRHNIASAVADPCDVGSNIPPNNLGAVSQRRHFFGEAISGFGTLFRLNIQYEDIQPAHGFYARSQLPFVRHSA